MNNRKSLFYVSKENPAILFQLFDILFDIRNNYLKKSHSVTKTSFIVKEKYQYQVEIIDEQLDYIIEILLGLNQTLSEIMSKFQPKIRRFDSHEKGAVWLHPYKELARNMLDNDFKEILENNPSKTIENIDTAEYLKEVNAEAIVRTKTIKRMQKTNRQLRTQIEYLKKYKSGNLTDSEIQQIVDSCRKKNGSINYTAVGKIIGLSKDTIRKLISDRKLEHLKEKPAFYTPK